MTGRLALTLLAVIALGASCNIIAGLGGGEGIACKQDPGCPSGLRCIDGVCRRGSRPADAGNEDTGHDDAGALPDGALPDGALPDARRDASHDAAAPFDASPGDSFTTDVPRQDSTAQPDSAPRDDAAAQADAVHADGSSADAAIEDASVSPTLVWIPIPGGSFEMGCSPGDTSCNGSEDPRHTVTVAAFEMTATEITQEQYQAVMGNNPSQHTNCPTCPAEQITWQQFKNFCAAAGGRLPSEAEWEYAARAGTTTKYQCGDDAGCLGAVAWWGANSDTGNGQETHPAGTKAANGFGLHDMHGNVWEWAEDCWHPDYVNAPATGGVWTGGTGENCSYRVLRGGSFDFYDQTLRVSHRYFLDLGNTGNYIGARCAR